MKQTECNDWINSVAQFRADVENLIAERNALFDEMKQNIKKAFDEAGNPRPAIKISAKGETIVCTWKDNTSLILNADLFSKIPLDFDFERSVSDDGDWVKKIIFYPFGRDII